MLSICLDLLRWSQRRSDHGGLCRRSLRSGRIPEGWWRLFRRSRPPGCETPAWTSGSDCPHACFENWEIVDHRRCWQLQICDESPTGCGRSAPDYQTKVPDPGSSGWQWPATEDPVLVEFLNTPAMTTNWWKEAGFRQRHRLTRGAMHGFHHELCKKTEFHAPIENCICVLCGQQCTLLSTSIVL